MPFKTNSEFQKEQGILVQLQGHSQDLIHFWQMFAVFTLFPYFCLWPACQWLAHLIPHFYLVRKEEYRFRLSGGGLCPFSHSRACNIKPIELQ